MGLLLVPAGQLSVVVERLCAAMHEHEQLGVGEETALERRPGKNGSIVPKGVGVVPVWLCVCVCL